MLSELGNFLLAMTVGFACTQSVTSFWGTYTQNPRYLTLGRVCAVLQGMALSMAFLTLIYAFLRYDFSLLLVYLHDHTSLPWYYRLAATWGNHEGSLLLFVLILSGMAVAQAFLLKNPLLRARTLTVQGILVGLFLLFLMVSSTPFTPLPFPATEGLSLNPLLQDRGLLSHPPLLYIGYVGFSGPFSLALAALWGNEDGPRWARLTRPWALFAWSFLTAGITLGSWWAYYELGWGGWWFWDPVENASLMPWLAGTALLHTLRSEHLYRWSLFLALLTFGLSLLGTFLVRSGLITSVHSFAQDPERGFTILCLLGIIMGTAFLIWGVRASRLQGKPLLLVSRPGALLVNSLLLCLGLLTVILGTFYPLLSEYFWGKTIAVGAPYFERTVIPLMIPLFILLPLGCLYQNKGEPFLPLLTAPLTALLGAMTLVLYVFYPLSLWSCTGLIMALWVIAGTVTAYLKERLSLGPTLIHLGVGLSLLGVSVGSGLRTDEMGVLSPGKSLSLGDTPLTLQSVQQGQRENYLYEQATLTYGGKTTLSPEKRLYQPQNSLLTKTAIHTNGFQDIYVILGPYQGDNSWLIRASAIPLAPWIWIGGAFMVLGGIMALMQRIFLKAQTALNFRMKTQTPFVPRTLALLLFLLALPFTLYGTAPLEQRAAALYQEVRCPVCLGQSIAESDMEESRLLKVFILDRLKAGDSEDRIREALRQQWGDALLFRPPFEPHTLVLWFLPFGVFLGLFLGLLCWWYRLSDKEF
jgi:cytochrome c-type biogenesis protein CcmF